jgi:hypothetical protein
MDHAPPVQSLVLAVFLFLVGINGMLAFTIMHLVKPRAPQAQAQARPRERARARESERSVSPFRGEPASNCYL